jgi:DNA-binding MarR family transcriptional regulator
MAAGSGNRPGSKVITENDDGITGGDRTPPEAALKLEDFLPYRLVIAATLTSQALSHIYSERYKIGVPEWRILVTLGQFGTMTGKAIGLHSHMHKTKVSRAVALLETRKLVARKTNHEDQRESFLSLTPAGRAIYDDLAPAALDFGRQLLGVVDAADRDALDRALQRITERSRDLANARGRR